MNTQRVIPSLYQIHAISAKLAVTDSATPALTEPMSTTTPSPDTRPIPINIVGNVGSKLPREIVNTRMTVIR